MPFAGLLLLLLCVCVCVWGGGGCCCFTAAENVTSFCGCELLVVHIVHVLAGIVAVLQSVLYL